jgi:serine/threonine protein kinase
MVDRIGQQFGNYRLIRLLGQGGFAEVYLGVHIHLDSQAAIKVNYSTLSDKHNDSFLIEAKRLVRLRHSHIIRLLEFGIEGNVPFIVMEYAPNGSLRTKHPKGSQVPLQSIVSYIKQVADALQYIHEQKFAHRDVKPENMLLGSNNEVLLSDLGIAVEALSTGTMVLQGQAGTTPYMAPEQLQGKPRRASDQYSLGIVVYEWICGYCPFHGSFTEIYSQHMFLPPPSLCEKIPGLSPAVEEVIFTALAKDPKQRFRSVQAFARALEISSQSFQLHSTTPSIDLPASSHSPSIAPIQELPSPLQEDSLNQKFWTYEKSAPQKPIRLSPLFLPHTITTKLNQSALSSNPTAPRLENKAMCKSYLKSILMSKPSLLIGLALIIVMSSFGLFILNNPNPMAIYNSNATVTAQANNSTSSEGTAIAQINATNTILIQAQATNQAYATNTAIAQATGTVLNRRQSLLLQTLFLLTFLATET